MDILWETPNEMETLTELSARLMEGKPKIRDWFKSVAVSVSAGFVSGKTEVGNPGRESTIRKLLQERCQKKPLALIIDEAHTLQPEVGKTLPQYQPGLCGQKVIRFCWSSQAPRIYGQL